MSNLLEEITENSAPLADKLRPQSIDEIVGQDHVLGNDGAIGRMLASGKINSLILWGTPGCGKTTLARVLADASGYEIAIASAVTSGVNDLKKQFEAARQMAKDGKKTILFVDEIHRFNRAQQDAFLPVVEDGTITLIGATTENPSFELNAALLSRCKLVVLKRLDEAALAKLLQRAEEMRGRALPLTEGARAALIAMADGDGRTLLNMADEVLQLPQVSKAGGQQDDPALSVSGSEQYIAQASRSSGDNNVMDESALAEFIGKRAPVYDKHQDGHYNLISALHKSIRGSDVQAALYWLCRMLDGGEDPLYLARRLVRMAVEDIGMAEPQAITQCMAAQQAYSFLGSPEGELALSQAVVFLATAPKSNAAYVAYKAAAKDAKLNGSLMPPAHILNAPTKMMKDIGYGEGYIYDPDAPDGFSGQDYFPEDMTSKDYYRPVERGFEREINKRLAYWAKLRQQRSL